MAETEKELELLARVIALEYLVKTCLMYIVRLKCKVFDGDTSSSAGEMMLVSKNIKRALHNVTIDDTDPAMSDHVSSLVEEWANRIITDIVEQMKQDKD
jgi:hypothetical protein